MVSSLRAVHLSSRSLQKGYYHSTSFRPSYSKFHDSPSNTFLNSASLFAGRAATDNSDSIERQSQAGRPHETVTHDEKIAPGEFQCRSGLQPQLNQPFLPRVNFTQPIRPNTARKQDEDETGTPSAHLFQKGPLSLDKQESTQIPSGDSSPNTQMKASRRSPYSEPSPSEFLIDTLQNIALSPEPPKIRNWTVTERNSQFPLVAPLSLKQRFKFKRRHRVSLQEIIADFIQFVDPVLRNRGLEAIFNDRRASSEFNYALQSMLRDDYLQYLTARHYDITNVIAWAWVLKSSTPYEAVLRMIMLEADQTTAINHEARRVPTFIPLMLLKQRLDLKTFRLLLIYSLHLISGQPIPPLEFSNEERSIYKVFDSAQYRSQRAPRVDPNMCVTYVVRLLRHARQLWPEAQLAISRAFAFYLGTLEPEGRDRKFATDRIVQFMAEKFNICLVLLSLPCKINPFASASIQQQAQFELLKAMANHQPVLPVTRRGYQGLVAVQLAHKKTFMERQTGELKASSWPPWKEDKLGLDSQRGVEGMKSRAMRVMSQMKEAGYSHSLWEEVSSIFAGWDTDSSPTIQTRILVRRPEILRGSPGRANNYAIWEARIRATRTVREAWACFLAYEDQSLTPHFTVYAAMAEKLIFRHRAVRNNFDQNSLALPGDGLEVFPEPSSARDWIYISTEPPTLDDFVKRMLSQGLPPRGRFLALLLRNAPSFSSGLEYLRSSNLTEQQIKSLCIVRARDTDLDAQNQRALDELPDYLFSAFIYFLCKFSSRAESFFARGDINTIDIFPLMTGSWLKTPPETTTLFAYAESSRAGPKFRHSKALAHAIYLLRTRNSQCTQGWVQLLSGLSSDRIICSSSSIIGRDTQRIIAWHEILEILEWIKERDVEIGFEGFHILCSSFSRAVTAGVKCPSAVEEGLKVVDSAVKRRIVHFSFSSPMFEDMIRSGLNTLKHQFERLVFIDRKASSLFEPLKMSLEGGTDSQVTLQALSRVPSPAALHAFVRSLGLAEDSDAILSLLRWMSEHSSVLKDACDEYLNGERMMRRTLVAVRTFLEGYWKGQLLGEAYELGFASQVTPYKGGDDPPTFTDPDLQSAYDIVIATKIWGPWPSDEEVAEYVSHGMR